MTNVQILFFCGLAVVFIAVMFLLLWKVHRVSVRISNLEATYTEDYQKMKDLVNKIYEKLKEVVEKVNPLLAQDATVHNNDEVIEAEYVDESQSE